MRKKSPKSGLLLIVFVYLYYTINYEINNSEIIGANSILGLFIPTCEGEGAILTSNIDVKVYPLVENKWTSFLSDKLGFTWLVADGLSLKTFKLILLGTLISNFVQLFKLGMGDPNNNPYLFLSWLCIRGLEGYYESVE